MTWAASSAETSRSVLSGTPHPIFRAILPNTVVGGRGGKWHVQVSSLFSHVRNVGLLVGTLALFGFPRTIFVARLGEITFPINIVIYEDADS